MMQALGSAGITTDNFIQKLKAYEKKLKTQCEEDKDLAKQEDTIVQNLSTFIKRNKALLHLNLDSC
jgi:hypothetical protein